MPTASWSKLPGVPAVQNLPMLRDEDIFDFLDPKANAWDLSSGPAEICPVANGKRQSHLE